MSRQIRVSLADGCPAILEALTFIINREWNMEVVGASLDSGEGLRVALDTMPDVAVFETHLPGNRGSFDVVDELAKRQPATKVIFYSDHCADILVEQALRVNARGYLMKSEQLTVLIKGIKRVHAGESCFSQNIQQRLRFDKSHGRYSFRSGSRLSDLTKRQIEILRCLAKGGPVKDVAKSLHLSEKCVESHKYRIMRKLKIHDRVSLARYAFREGLLQP